MALNRVWSAQAVNQLPNDQTTLVNQCKSIIWAFKRFITGLDPVVSGGAWTVESSSDSVTAGAGDNWGTAIDLTKTKWHTAGSAHSWIVFKSPSGFAIGGGFVYLLIDLIGTGADTGTINWRIEIASTFAPFTGGTTLNAPTSTSRARINSGVTKQMIQSALFPGKWHGTRNTRGDFWFFFSKDGAGLAQTVMSVFVTENPEVNDNYPVGGYFHFLETVPRGVLDTTILGGNSSVGPMVLLWSGGGAIGTGDSIQHAVNVPYSPDGTQPLNSFDGGGSDITGNYPKVASDIYVHATNYVSYRGRIADCPLAPRAASIGQTTGTPATAPEQVIIGDFWIPFSTKPVF